MKIKSETGEGENWCCDKTGCRKTVDLKPFFGHSIVLLLCPRHLEELEEKQTAPVFGAVDLTQRVRLMVGG